MRKARLPRREEFRKDVYVGYADTDADCDMACMTLPRCLTERHNVTLLLRHEEEIPGCVRAETIVEHMDDCWKVGHMLRRECRLCVLGLGCGERGGEHVCQKTTEWQLQTVRLVCLRT